MMGPLIAFFVFFGAFGCAISLLAIALLFLSGIESVVTLGIFGWMLAVSVVILLIGFTAERAQSERARPESGSSKRKREWS